MLHKLKGAGLPNVFLSGGFTIEGSGEDQTIAYENLDGLYREISRAIALRAGVMSGAELRFLRKRIDASQADVAMLGGKTEQAVAKWEKGELPVPKAEANLLRLSVLSRFGTKEEIARVVSQLSTNGSKGDQFPYVFKYEDGKWTHDDSAAIQFRERSVLGEVVLTLRSEPETNVLAELKGQTSHAYSVQISLSQSQISGEEDSYPSSITEEVSTQYFPLDFLTEPSVPNIRLAGLGGQRHSLIKFPA